MVLVDIDTVLARDIVWCRLGKTVFVLRRTFVMVLLCHSKDCACFELKSCIVFVRVACLILPFRL